MASKDATEHPGPWRILPRANGAAHVISSSGSHVAWVESAELAARIVAAVNSLTPPAAELPARETDTESAMRIRLIARLARWLSDRAERHKGHGAGSRSRYEETMALYDYVSGLVADPPLAPLSDAARETGPGEVALPDAFRGLERIEDGVYERSPFLAMAHGEPAMQRLRKRLEESNVDRNELLNKLTAAEARATVAEGEAKATDGRHKRALRLYESACHERDDAVAEEYVTAELLADERARIASLSAELEALRPVLDCCERYADAATIDEVEIIGPELRKAFDAYRARGSE